MKLNPIAKQILVKSYSKALLESITGDAQSVQTQMFDLGKELKKDGEDVTDEEVQAAMLSALIKADGDVENVDVSDVESIKTEIKSSRNYVLTESGVLHSIESVGTVLGNAALLHALAGGMQKIGMKNFNENKFKTRIEKLVSSIKKITGYPAHVMEQAFTWVAKKLGAGAIGQKIAGIAGALLVTIAFLTLAIYLFPSITSPVLLIFAIGGIIGKGTEIINLIKQLVKHIGEYLASKPELSKSYSSTLAVAGNR